MRVVWRAQNKRMHHSLWCRLRLPGKGLIGIRMLHMFAFTLHCNRHKNQNQLLINAWQRAQWHRIYRQKKKKYHIIRKQIYLLIVNKNNGLAQHMCQFNEMCHLLLMEMHSQCCFLCVLCAPQIIEAHSRMHSLWNSCSFRMALSKMHQWNNLLHAVLCTAIKCK